MYLCQDRLAQLHSFSFLRLKTDDLVVDFLIEDNPVNVVEQAEQMSLRDREIERERQGDTFSDNNKQYRKEGKRKKSRQRGSGEGRKDTRKQENMKNKNWNRNNKYHLCVTCIVCESEAWPRISSRAGSDTKKKRGNTKRFFSR